MIPVFLSRPNPFLIQQEYFIDKVINILQSNFMFPETLVAKDYNPYESLSCLNEMIKRCYGIIIIAFGQLYIEKGISKKGAVTDNNFFDSTENILNRMWITSPFCHIEGAIAFCNNIPLLVLEQEQIKIEGILKDGDHAIICPKFSLRNLKEIDLYFKDKQLINTFSKWIKKVNKKYNFVNNNIV